MSDGLFDSSRSWPSRGARRWPAVTPPGWPRRPPPARTAKAVIVLAGGDADDRDLAREALQGCELVELPA